MENIKNINRRKFLSNTTVAMTATCMSFFPGRILGANERLNFAVIGCGGRGRYVARGLIEEGANLVALCDVHEERLDKTEQFLQDVLTQKPYRTQDMNRILDDKNIDAVAIATPDHWHALATIKACQAGKDVYIEKPHAHNIWESQQMIKAAGKYNRIVDVGTQNRSAPYVYKALDYINSGNLGKIGLVKTYNLKSGKRFEMGQAESKPPELDWDSWLGPAPDRPFHQRIFYYGWHKFWAYCGGDIADDGIHQLDLTLLLLGDPGLPRSVSCTGGRLVYADDDAEVPDVQIATYDFSDFILTFEMSNYPRYMQKTTSTIRRNDDFPYWTQNATRIEIYGSELMMTIGRMGGGWQVMTSGGRVVKEVYGRPPDQPHYRNFIKSVKTRQRPNADIRIAHNAFTTVHMANVALKMGNQTLRYDPMKGKFANSEANQYLKRIYREKFRVPEQV